MKLTRLEISNFRCFPELDWAIDGRPAFLVSSSGAGKTALMTAIALALGRERVLTRADFVDATAPIEITVTLTTTSEAEAPPFADFLDFIGPPTLRVALRAVADPFEEDVQIVRERPDAARRAIPRRLLDLVPLFWLPSWRDPARLLALVGPQSLVRRIVKAADIETQLTRARESIVAAIEELGGAEPLADLVTDLGLRLTVLLPPIPADGVGLGNEIQSNDDLLRQLHLALAFGGAPVRVGRNSTGIGHLAVFALLLRLLTEHSIILLDEPEIALPPHTQRALTTALQKSGAQYITATHSPAILQRSDPRRLVRLERGADGAALYSGGPLSNAEAAALVRFAGPATAEAYFARKVILVEGLSDQFAIQRLAARAGIDLDALAVSVVACEGADSFRSYLDLLGSNGLRLTLLGLCDFDRSERWREALSDIGVPVDDQADMAEAGFFVATPDLESELLGALGLPAAEAAIEAAGRLPQLELYRKQPSITNRGWSAAQLLYAFVSREKVWWAPRLVDALDLDAAMPSCLFDMLARV